MKHFGIYITLLLAFASCERATWWDTTKEFEPHYVVDALLTDEYKNQEIYISQSIAALNDIPQKVDDAIVRVFTQDSNWLFLYDGEGKYLSEKAFKTKPDQVYRLQIIIDEDTFRSNSQMLPLNNFESLIIQQAASDSLFRIKYIGPTFDLNDAAMYHILIDWSHLPAYDSLAEDECRALIYHYTLTDVDVSQLLPPQAENILFPKGSIIYEKKYSLNREYEEFIRSLLLETTWTGGLFDMQHSNLPSNISEDVLGFFTCCSVMADTVLVE